MIEINSLLSFLSASIILSLAPGPDNIFVLTQSALYGKKSGVVVTLGLCTGLIFHTLAVGFGLATILKTSPVAFNILKYIGAAYLVYLAFLSFKAKASGMESNESSELEPIDLYIRGIIMNITNPKVSIFFLAFLPQFIDHKVGSVFYQTLIFGALFGLCAFIVFSTIAFLAGSIGKGLRNSPRVQLLLNRFTGIVFLALCIKLIISH